MQHPLGNPQASISFDRIAARYDATRGFPFGVEAQIGASFRRVSGLPTNAHLLEIGVGTGRIALPLAAQGYRYTGLDLSLDMMARLGAQLPPGAAIRLVRGDATALPLHDDSMDGAVAVHVFHLIAGWQRAIAELRRVVRPSGILAIGANHTPHSTANEQLRNHWRAIVRELGGDTSRPGAPLPEVEALLTATFGPGRRETLATWEQHESLGRLLGALAARTNSYTWAIPDAILHESLRRAETWARETYGDLDQQHTTEAHFVMVFYENRKA
jgi:ubiquinone/menaquinone biosynthesis C-methylase UbiE